ncbi:hypothetical protein FNV43_RR00397 [Rhamnella rubrinervis]|uniref:DUF1985 domain-containing protein n=1 Tax=Rhamnella rubrinervis TaxID=2594499 RepID=A0A8K0HNK8_9ROSA|nr:hypothetical protein FNV43_RR00397 [Rhamnella rubrinervis]
MGEKEAMSKESITYFRMFDKDDMYSAKVTIKSNLNEAMKKIRSKLNSKQLGLFESTCFGHFLHANELQVSGSIINQMLWRQCVGHDMEVMEFSFGGTGARFTIQEFGLITGLCCGAIPTDKPSPHHFRDTYFGGRKLPLHNSDIVDVFDTTTCKDDHDMLRLALLFFLETVVLSKEAPTPVRVDHIDMLDDLDYFNSYPWGTVSYHITVRSMRGCPARRANNSHTYTLIGFPLAFMLWGYETIPPIATMFGIKSKDITCPRLLNWTTTGFATTKKLDPIFSKPNMKVINALEPTPSEMDFVQSIHWPTGWRPYDAPPIVAEKKSNDAVKESKRDDANAVKKVVGKKKIHRDEPTASPAPHANPNRDDGDDDIIGGDGYGMDHGGGDDYGMDHGGGHPLPLLPITKVRCSPKCPPKLAGGRRKRRAARDIQSPYECDTLRRKMVRTLPRSNRTFDPYRPIFDDVAQQYAQFMNSGDEHAIVEYDTISVKKIFFRELEFSPTWLMDDHIQVVTHLIRQRAGKYPEVFNPRILLLDNRLVQYMTNRLDDFMDERKDKAKYNFGDEMLEFVNGKRPILNIKPWTAYDRVLLVMNRQDIHWLLGDINLAARHMTIYDCRHRGNDIELEYFGKLLPMFPYLIHAAGFYRKLNMPFSPRPFTISLASKCPQMHTDVVHGMRDPELHVRVDSVFALCSFVEACRDLNEICPILPQLFDGSDLQLGDYSGQAAAFWRCMNTAEADDRLEYMWHN